MNGFSVTNDDDHWSIALHRSLTCHSITSRNTSNEVEVLEPPQLDWKMRMNPALGLARMGSGSIR
jgi:hypothetical protein